MSSKNVCYMIIIVLFALVESFHSSAASSKSQRDHAIDGGGVPNLSLNSSDSGNQRLHKAYVALQAWKAKIAEDPRGITKTWVGYDVCQYDGVYCWQIKSGEKVVSGIDLNHAMLAGSLVPELSMLSDIAFLHLSSNRFKGTLPNSLKNLQRLSEIDVSNNRLSGPFPTVVLSMSNLVYLDLRFNLFAGTVPAELFSMKNLDALFLNNNNFEGEIPETLGSSRVSVVSFANNNFQGRIPSSIGNMTQNLNEVLFLKNKLSGTLPMEIGKLQRNLYVLDVSYNDIEGALPSSLGCLDAAEQLILEHNNLCGFIPDKVCSLKNLQKLNVSSNYFTQVSEICLSLRSKQILFDSSENCVGARTKNCASKIACSDSGHKVSCSSL